MRSIVFVLLVLPLTGCIMELLSTTAIQSTLQAESATAAMKQLHRAQDQSNRNTMRQAIGVYTAETGAYPVSLHSLVPEYLAEVPVRPDGLPYEYDPISGTLREAHARGPQITIPISDDDRNTMAMLRDSIYDYADWTGYYPGSLEALIPDYLRYVPVTTSGHTYVYNPMDGSLRHPAQSPGRRVAPINSGSVGMGGAGLLGETLTGIGLQQQIGNMNNAGSSAAGARARQNIDQLQSDYSDRQMQMLDDLDL